jgi:hypothetical protein
MGEVIMSDESVKIVGTSELPVVPAVEVVPQYDPATDPMHPYGKSCSICSTEFEENEWGIMGWLGILPVSFCTNCTTGLYNMVLQTMSVEELESLIEEKRAEESAAQPSAE